MMSSRATAIARVAADDAQQYLTFYLSLLLLVLLATWPAGGSGAGNDSWFAMGYARSGALSLLGLGYGVVASGLPRPERSSVAVMLTIFALLGLPFEIAAYAASYPRTPLAWVLALPVPTVLAMLMVGMALGSGLRRLRILFLAPLLVPLLLAGAAAADLSLGFPVLSPITAPAVVSLPHLALLTLLTLLLLYHLIRGEAAARGERRGS